MSNANSTIQIDPPYEYQFYYQDQTVPVSFSEIFLARGNQMNSSMSSLGSTPLSSSYSSNNGEYMNSNNSGCSSPSNFDEICSQSSSTSSTSSIRSLPSAVYQAPFYMTNTPNWPSVLFTPCLYPSLYEPCEYYFYSLSSFFEQQHHYAGYETQLDPFDSDFQSKLDELNQNVNNLIENNNNNNNSNSVEKISLQMFKDITNGETSKPESPSQLNQRGVEKKWLQGNYQCFYPSKSMSNQVSAAKKQTQQVSSDMENRMKRYPNNTPINSQFYATKKAYNTTSVIDVPNRYSKPNAATSTNNNKFQKTSANFKNYHYYNQTYSNLATNNSNNNIINHSSMPNKYRAGNFLPKTRS